MERCKRVQAEMYVIRVVESSNCYAHLRFSLLASPWFLRPLGLALWGVLHMLLVGCITLMLLAFFSAVFAAALSSDAFILCLLIYLLLLEPVIILVILLIKGIVIALVWMFLVLCCKCCTIPGRSSGQSLGHYILSVGGLLTPLFREPQPVNIMGAASPWAALKKLPRKALSVRLVKFLTVESFLFWRVVLGKFCQEIVPLYDTVVI